MDQLTNRELALAIWITFFICVALPKKSIRNSVGELIKSAVSPKLIIPFTLMIFYLSVYVCLLYRVGVWDTHLLIATITWSLFSGTTLAFRCAVGSLPPDQWKIVVSDHFKIIVVFTFIVSTYTFPLLVELLLIPFLTFIGLLEAFAINIDKTVARFLGYIQAFLGWLILGAAVIMAYQEYQAVQIYSTLQLLLLPVILTLALIPFIYVFTIYAGYDNIWVHLQHVSERNPKLALYMKWRLIQKCFLSLSRVKCAESIKPYEMRKVETREEFDVLLIKHSI